MNTGYMNPNKVRIVTIDTKERFMNTTGDESCSFDSFFSSPLNISKNTSVYLSNLFIGGYKICSQPHYYNHDNNYKDVVNAFMIDIPDLEMITIGADGSGNREQATSVMNKKSVLILESPSIISTSGAVPSDYKPFILGHLSKTAVYLAKVGPKKLTSLNVTITDQDGDHIWKSKWGDGNGSHGSGVDANPPSRSRRVIMQLMFVEEE